MAIGIDPKIDFAFKKLLGSRDHPAITLHFLNSVLGGDPVIASVEILNPFMEKDSEDDKLSVLDVKATDDHGRLLDIEMQTSSPGELASRLTYYVASQYVRQLKDGEPYRVLKPSIGITVLNAILFQEVPDLLLDFRMRSQNPQLTLSNVLQLHLFELPKYTPPSDNRAITDPIEMWAFFFRYAAQLTPDELAARLPDPVFAEAAGVMEMISRTPEERELYEARLKFQRDEQSRLDAAEERGLAKGAMIGKIQLLQQLLGDVEQETDELSSLDRETLSTILEKLQQRLRSRS